MSDSILIVINDTDPVKEKHICWFSEIKDGEITLFEVVERWYRHPQAPDLGRINNIEIVRRNSFRMHSFAASPLHILKHSQETMTGMVAVNPDYTQIRQLHVKSDHT